MENALTQTGVVLAVDDDPDDLELLCLLLRKAGFPSAVDVYREGRELVSRLTKLIQASAKTLRPLLCFVDVKMPGMDGFEILEWIRQQPQLDRLPGIMLSSSEHPTDVRRAVERGAQCYLSKYPQPAVLREVIGEAERFALGAPAEDCFRIPNNQLLVRGRRV
ncbi:MAG TPA: response regulator [Opitutaceae bacterium]|nr:response regulator [Opitutaceae bacterium]